MNMTQPQPGGLFEPAKQKQQAPAADTSVIAQLQNRPATAGSLPPVNAAPAPAPAPVAMPAAAPPPVSNNPLVAMSQSGQLQALLKAKAEQMANQPPPENPLVSLAANGGIRKLVMAKEDQQYKQQHADWEKASQVKPLPGLGYAPQEKAGPEPQAPARSLDQLESDWNRGIHDIRKSEFSNILNLIETGQMTPEQEAKITQNIEPAIDPEYRWHLQVARLARDKTQQLKATYDAQMAEQQRLKSEAGQSGLTWEAYRQASTPQQQEQLRGAVKGMTFGQAFSPDEDRLNSTDAEVVADERAKRNFYLGEQAKYPFSSMGGFMIGAMLPFGLGVKGIRAGRVALAEKSVKAGTGTAATANIIKTGGVPGSTLGHMGEGALVGAGYDTLLRPEGAEDMTTQEYLRAKAEQMGLGLAVGAFADAALLKGIPSLARGIGKGGSWVSDQVKSVVTTQKKKELDKAASELGYNNFDEFADAATEIITDATGSRIRLKPDILNGLSEADQARAGDLLNRLNPEANHVPGSPPVTPAESPLSRAAQDRPDETQFPTLKPESEQGGSLIHEPTVQEPTAPTTAAQAGIEGAPGAGRSAAGEAEPVVPERTESAVETDLTEPPVKAKIQGLQVVEAPLSELTLSRDVPQFKSGADESGIVEPLGGTFERTGVAPIQVWVRNDGSKEVISGRHRLDLARRSGEETIPAQYHYESEGFTKQQAAILDATLNIREGQGKVKDYVDYIRESGLTEEAALAEGILARATGQRAYTIATEGSDAIITAHRNNRLSDDAAAGIAHAAPGNERLQAVGIKAKADGKSNAEAINMVKAVRSMSGDRPQTSGDMFGFDDSAIKEAEAMAKRAGAKQAEIQKTLSAVKGASKNPTLAAKEGVDIHDPDALKQRIAELEAQKDAWQNWHTNPELVAELRSDLGLSPSVNTLSTRAEPEPDIEPSTRAEVPENQGGFFDDFDLTQPTAKELEAKAKAEQEALAKEQQQQTALEAKAKADAEVNDFELGIQGSGKDVSANQGDMLGLGGRSTEEPLSTQPSLKTEAETGGKTPEGTRQQELETLAKKQATDPIPGTSLYSTPIIPAARQVANMLHLNPWGAVGGAVYGGIAGGDASEAERYSPQWWLDSVFSAAAWAVAGSAGFSAVNGAKIKGKTLFGQDSWGSQSLKYLGEKIGKIPNFGVGDKDIIPMKKQQKLLKALIERQAEKAGQYLLDNFTPSERAAMSDLIEQRGIIAEGNLLHRQAQELDDFIAYTAKKMQDLGMLDDTIEPGGYLHRYYAKDLGITGLMRGLTPGGKTMSGSWSRRRGTQEVFDRRYMSQSMRDTLDEVQNLIIERDGLKNQAGDLVGADTQGRIDDINAQLKELQSIEFREYTAIENGKLKSFFLHPDEVPVIPGLKAGGKTGLPEPIGQGTLEGMDKPRTIGKTGQLALTDRRWTIDGKEGEKGGILHRDWTKAERENWGEIHDAAYRMVRGQAEVAHDLSLGIFYKQVVDRFQGTKVSDTEVAGWHKVPDTKIGDKGRLKKYGALAGKYVTPEVWAAVKHHGRNPLLNLTNNHPAVKNYLNLLGKWKAYKTVYNPVSHVNNTVGNLGMYYMSDYSPKHLGSAIKELYQGENSALYREARDNGLFGTDFTTTLNMETGQKKLDELLEKLRNQEEVPDLNETLDTLMSIKQWFIESKNAVAGANGPWQTGLELAAAVGNPLVNTAKKPINAAANFMQRAYQLEDEFFKMAVYMAERQKGTKPVDAVTAANKYFFDYSEMPTAFQVARDSPIGSPFISYTYYAVPALARTAVEKPEKLFAFAAFLEGVNYAGMAINGELQEEGYWDRMAKDEEVLPSWMKGRSLFGGLNNISIPYVDSYKLGLANMLPAGNPFVGNAEREGYWPAILSPWGSGWHGSNPVAVLLNDLTNNRDWRGAQIYDPYSASKAEKIRKGINYIYQNLAPNNPLFPGSYSQQKITEGAANEVRQAELEGEQPNAILESMVDIANATSETFGAGQFTGLDRANNEILFRDALMGAMGVKLRPVRLEQSADYKMSDLGKKIQGLERWIARHRLNYDEGRNTKDQLEKYERLYEAKAKAYSQQTDRIEAAR